MSLIRFAALSCAIATSIARADTVLEYQPALNTKPASQGWTYSGDGSEPGSAAAGVFTYGPTTTGGTNFWTYDHATQVDFSAANWFIEARVRLTDTTHGNVSGFRRGGFTLYLHDNVGRGIIADIGSASLSLRSDNNGTSDPSVAIDLASSFRTIRLEARASQAALLVDGVQVLTHAYGLPASGGTAFWGDASILASSAKTEIGYVRLVPAPGMLGLILAAGLSAVRRSRK